MTLYAEVLVWGSFGFSVLFLAAVAVGKLLKWNRPRYYAPSATTFSYYYAPDGDSSTSGHGYVEARIFLPGHSSATPNWPVYWEDPPA